MSNKGHQEVDVTKWVKMNYKEPQVLFYISTACPLSAK
jgi:hypothetical protein